MDVDHKPLTTILGEKKHVPQMEAACLQCWAIKLQHLGDKASAYSYVIEFRRTHEHSNADGLSRLPVNWLMLLDVVLSLHSLT